MPALDKAALDTLSEPIWDVWNYIGHDIEGMIDDNDCAIEMCIDADRLTTCADDPEAQAFVHELIKEHGYTTTLEFLSKHMRFV
jgi:hypothetical protein